MSSTAPAAARRPARRFFFVAVMQQSGSVRLYAHRPTLRYDVLEADWLDRACAHLAASGYELYLLLEDFEVRPFRERFAGQQTVAVLDGPPMAVTDDRQVQLYRFGEKAEDAGPTVTIPRTSGCK